MTSAIVALGVCLGHSYLTESPRQDYFHTQHRTDVDAAFANWDGQWYVHFAGMVLVIGYGAWRCWLAAEEVLFAAGVC